MQEELNTIVETPEGSTITRDTPEPNAARAQLVSKWCQTVTEARSFWTNNAFERMVEDMRFAAGKQWGGSAGKSAAEQALFLEDEQERYVANITLRHVQSRTASIYGKNPKVVSRRKERLLSTVWDGSGQTLQTAMQAVKLDPLNQMANAVLLDAQKTLMENQRLDKMAKTLELLFEHEIEEQALPFKVQMKGTVRRALTTGVGYVKLGYERIMQRAPDVDRRIEATEQRLATLERLAADVADGELHEDDPEMEQLRGVLNTLSQTPEIVVREGLTFHYPDSTAIIIDPDVKQLRGFVGAGWAAEEYFLSADRIKEVYQVDVSAVAPGDEQRLPRAYERTKMNTFKASDSNDRKNAYHCVWEIYNRADGMVYVVCDGYPDFLVEPSAPDIKLERFFPWFPFCVNEVYDDETVFPLSDVRLMRHMQEELNRSRQGLREHRVASRPRTYTRKGVLGEDDKGKIQNSQAHEVVELEGLAPQEKIQDVLQAHAGPGIDQNLYSPAPAYEDYLRSLGQQEANLGGTSGATATEASIAEGSRTTSVSSVVDDLDEFLTELTRAAGQVLLMECGAEKVKRVVGPGAIWPELDRETIANEILLEVEAASTGRPNKAAEVQAAQAIFPLLMQIPGMSPEWMGRELVRRMDDRLDLSDAFAAGMPSVQLMNASRTPVSPDAVASGNDPSAQGRHGADNAPSTQPPRVNEAPVAPSPGPQV